HNFPCRFFVAEGITLDFHDDHCPLMAGVLSIWQIELREIRFKVIVVARVSDYANDLPSQNRFIGVGKCWSEVVPDRVRAGEIFSGESAADDGHWCGFCIIVIRSKGPTSQQRDGKGREVAGFCYGT